jgi:beta-glucuronidase
MNRRFHRLVLGAVASAIAAAECAPGSGDAPVAVASPRANVELAAGGRFQLDEPDVGEREGWQAADHDRSAWAAVEVPGAWDLFDEGMWGYEGVGWYATAIDGPPAAGGVVRRLKFGRVNYHAKVWLNGRLLGENVNGYLPFEFDVTDKLLPGAANQLVVRVDNTARLKWLPGAKKIEWMLYGGILEPVILETTPEVYVSDLTVGAVPRGVGAAVDCAVEVTSQARQAADVRVRAAVAGAAPPVDATLKVAPGGKAVQRFSIPLARADPWSPETPQLYTLTASAESAGSADTLASRFGVRTVEARGRDILLNGRRFVARGVNRYDEYGRFGPRPPCDLLRADLRRMKDAGVNMVRVHYPQSPELLGLYDEVGFVLCEEVPVNWWGNDFSGKGEEVLDEGILDQAMPALERMIRRDKNHPCVILWSMANESRTDTPAGIAVMRKLIRRAKELNPGRLTTFVVSTQDVRPHRAYEDADLVAVNVYHGVFHGPVALHAAALEERVTRPSEAYLRRQLAAFPDKPLLVTEYGTRGVRGLRGDMAYTEDFQAALNEAAWRAVRNCPEVSGGVLWCWADYHHRRTFNDNGPFGSFGVVTVDRRPKAALRALARMYGGRVDAAPAGR